MTKVILRLYKLVLLLFIVVFMLIYIVKNEFDDHLGDIVVDDKFYTEHCINTLVYEENSHHFAKGHRYEDSSNIRFIILTYNRPKSLAKVLRSLQDQELDGHTGSVDIWIDRSVAGEVHNQTLSVAGDFCWNRGATTVHVHSKHVGLYGQWMNTWRPLTSTPELEINDTFQVVKEWGVPDRISREPAGKRATETLVMMIEDDIDISPFAYRWLRAAHVRYGGREDVFGYGLQDENTLIADGKRRYFDIPRDDKALVFGHVVPGTWALAPHPARWRHFQTWFESKYSDKRFVPFVKGARIYNEWYKEFRQRYKSVESVISLWMARFASDRKLVTIFSNNARKLGHRDSSLVANRREKGLHFPKNMGQWRQLMKRWDQASIEFPEAIKVYTYNGSYLTTLSNW